MNECENLLKVYKYIGNQFLDEKTHALNLTVNLSEVEEVKHENDITKVFINYGTFELNKELLSILLEFLKSHYHIEEISKSDDLQIYEINLVGNRYYRLAIWLTFDFKGEIIKVQKVIFIYVQKMKQIEEEIKKQYEEEDEREIEEESEEY